MWLRHITSQAYEGSREMICRNNMKKRMKSRLCLLLTLPVCLATATTAFGDAVHLKSGEQSAGRVFEGRLASEWHRMMRPDGTTSGEVITLIRKDGSYRTIARSDIEKIDIAPELRAPKGAALLVKATTWGATGHGYQAQLIPVSSEYVIGKPMRFSLVLQNTSDEPRAYDAQTVTKGWEVMGPDGESPPYVGGSYQTLGGRQPMDPFEIVSVFEGEDLTRYFLMVKPGPYSVGIREGNYGIRTDPFPASNTVTIRVKPGTPRKEDLVSQALIRALPNEEWRFEGRYTGEQLTPFGREQGAGTGYALSTMRVHSRLKSDVVLVHIWQMRDTAESLGLDDVTGPGESRPMRSSELLGKNDGYVYVSIPSNAVAAWPSIESGLKQVFGIE